MMFRTTTAAHKELVTTYKVAATVTTLGCAMSLAIIKLPEVAVTDESMYCKREQTEIMTTVEGSNYN